MKLETLTLGPAGTANRVRHNRDPGVHYGTLPRNATQHEWSSDFEEAAFRKEPWPWAETSPPGREPLRRILIADDDALVRGSLAAVLESEGFIVDEVDNGIETVRRAIERPPDLVLLDLNMPEWDGWTAFIQLDRVTPLLPVIVITARPNQFPKAMQLGVDAFMEKPLNIWVLLRAIKQLVSEDRHLRQIANRPIVTRLLSDSEC